MAKLAKDETIDESMKALGIEIPKRKLLRLGPTFPDRVTENIFCRVDGCRKRATKCWSVNMDSLFPMMAKMKAGNQRVYCYTYLCDTCSAGVE